MYLYNFIKLNVNQYELKLIEREFADIDNELEPAETTLNWKSEDIWDYVDGLRIKVSKLSSRVKQAKINLQKIDQLIYQWHEVSIIERINDPKAKDTLLNLAEKDKSTSTGTYIAQNIGEHMKKKINLF